MRTAMKGTPESAAGWSLYRRTEAPQSRGRVPLPAAFKEYCCMRWGISGDEIAAAFEGPDREDVREMVALAVELLGGTFVQGTFQTWARPVGGGVPEEIPADYWELDDLSVRFATATINMRRPFDPEAEATHSIFVDAATRDAFLDACCVDLPGYGVVRHRRDAADSAGEATPELALVGVQPDAILRLQEVKRLTGLARSTIYARMARREFPQSLDLGGRQTGWSAADISHWLAGRSRRGD